LGEVTVIAPERQQSAAGHGITLHKPLRMTAVSLDAPVAEAFATNGTPADCTILAAADDRPKPDLVVAGINAGANLGEEVLYSGTASAAMEGALQGITSFAISVTAYEDCIFEPAAEYAARLARRLAKHRSLKSASTCSANSMTKAWRTTRSLSGRLTMRRSRSNRT